MKSILIISTFGTGATYVERASTFWIHRLIDPTIINVHDLQNGLILENGYLFKKFMDNNEQPFEEIQNLLMDINHPVLARIAYDHWLTRTDSNEEKSNFLKFINEYFDVYVCYRDNLFDYGLCWAVRQSTDRGLINPLPHLLGHNNNVHTPLDRNKLYVNSEFKIDPQLVINQSIKYIKYQEWASESFPTAKPFYYEKVEENIDLILHEYFPSIYSIKDKFGISISKYSVLRYRQSLNIELSPSESKSVKQITALVDHFCKTKVMIDPIPIKSTTITDKFNKIINFDETVDFYNEWAVVAGKDIVTKDWIKQTISREEQIYDCTKTSTL